MKKLMFALLTLGLVLTACSNDDTEGPEIKPKDTIEGLSFPTLTTGSAGSSITIDGKGFGSSDIITLRGLSGNRESSAGDIAVTVTGVTTTSLTFTLPGTATDPLGYIVLITRGEETEMLGMLRYDTAKSDEPADATLVTAMVRTYPETWYAFDEKNFVIAGEAKEIVFPDDEIVLELMGVTSIEGLEYFTGASSLNLNGNNLGKVYLSNFADNSLEKVSMESAGVTLFVAPNQTALKELYLSDNPVSRLDLTALTGLEILKCTGCPLIFLDLTKNADLDGDELEFEFADIGLGRLNLSLNWVMNGRDYEYWFYEEGSSIKNALMQDNVNIYTYDSNGQASFVEPSDYEDTSNDQYYADFPNHILADYLRLLNPRLFAIDGKLRLDQVAQTTITDPRPTDQGITDLRGAGWFVASENLRRYYGLEKLTSLEGLERWADQITGLDIADMADIEELDLSPFTQLSALYAWGTAFRTIDFGTNWNLGDIRMNQNTTVTSISVETIGVVNASTTSFDNYRFHDMKLEVFDMRHKWTAREGWAPSGSEDCRFGLYSEGNQPKEIHIDKYIIEKYDLFNLSGASQWPDNDLLRILLKGETEFHLYEGYALLESPDPFEPGWDEPGADGSRIAIVKTLEEYKQAPKSIWVDGTKEDGF